MTVINAIAASVLPLIRHIAGSTPAAFGRFFVNKSGTRSQSSGYVAPSLPSISMERPSLVRQIRPVRMVRVVEAGQSKSNAGRMVISGRMADVCAELDRLVARESTTPAAHSLPY